MKKQAAISAVPRIPLNERNTLIEANENLNTSSKAVENIMTEQLVIPPSRVWDKIEQILDQQDNRRNSADKIIADSFRSTNSVSTHKSYILMAAGMSVVAGILWKTL